MDDADLRHLRRCVDLAAEALDAGDEPFGSVLVDADGRVRHEDRNRTQTLGDATRHPEFELARWAAANLTAGERAGATVYTSGEHCAMCSAAHAWVGLGRIVFAASAPQMIEWYGDSPSPVRTLRVTDVTTDVVVEGPSDELAPLVRELVDRQRGR